MTGVQTCALPIYQCGMNPETGMIFTSASESDKFKEGFGLITMDELVFAGGVAEVESYGSYSAPNTYYSRNSVSDCSQLIDCNVTGQYGKWWTMTPSRSYDYLLYIYYSGINGIIEAYNSLDGSATSSLKIRPVLSLKSNTLVSGSGTATDPYVVTGI